MIDLHMHTTYSDGTNSLIDLLKLAEKKNLDCISITDHNTVKSYFELETLDTKKYFTGNILTGVELNTRVLNIPIEILVYDIDIVKMNELTNENFLSTSNRNFHELHVLYKACLDNNVVLPADFIEKYDISMYASVYFLERLLETQDLDTILNLGVEKECLEDFKLFYRYHISNPSSAFYINPQDSVLDIKDLISIIRKIGGKVFLAHVYEYKSNADKILDYVVKNCDIDGIECYYSTFTKEQKKYLVNLCKKNNLLISGGSDYHGTLKPNIDLGTGNSNTLIVPNSILDDWNK